MAYTAEQWRRSHLALAAEFKNISNSSAAKYSKPSLARADNQSEVVEEGASEDLGMHDDLMTDNDEFNDSSSSDSNELVFVVNEQMIEFFKISMKHKMELKKQREEELHEELANRLKDKENDRLNKKKEEERIKLLYGEDAPKLIEMETELQKSFDCLREQRKPRIGYWPCIPFNP